MFRLIQLVTLFAATSAFTASMPAFRQPMVASPTARSVLMSDSETEQVLKTAGDCVDGECSLEEVSELLSVLQSTEKDLESRLENIMNMIGHLQHINEKDERKTDEVRGFVKDLLRVFSTQKPITFPSGYSGDIGKGATTAYDALPPKKWTAKK